jgi:hypothetical protein
MNPSRWNSPPARTEGGIPIKPVKTTPATKGHLGDDVVERKTPKSLMMIRENLKIVMSFEFERVAFQVGKRP